LGGLLFKTTSFGLKKKTHDARLAIIFRVCLEKYIFEFTAYKFI
jgi:hypothetical protein